MQPNFPHPRLHVAVNPKAEPKKGRIKISPNKTLQSFINVAASPKIHVPVQARNQDFMWGGANEAKVDQTTEMYFLLSDPFI